MFKSELNLLFLTFQYYSRIPTPRTVYSEEALSRSFRYFPLVGAVVGGLGGLVYWGGSFILPQEISVMLALIVMTLATGAIHEDGFADTFDGFGGGYDRERILAIMRDSSSGVFGVTALILLFGLEFLLLGNLPSRTLPFALIAAETSSRAVPLLLINTAGYARKDESKGQHTRRKLSPLTLTAALLIALLSLLLIPWQAALITLPVYALLFLAFRRYLLRKIGGYTGDTLGALIVLCRLALLLVTLLAVTVPFGRLPHFG